MGAGVECEKDRGMRENKVKAKQIQSWLWFLGSRSSSHETRIKELLKQKEVLETETISIKKKLLFYWRSMEIKLWDSPSHHKTAKTDNVRKYLWIGHSSKRTNSWYQQVEWEDRYAEERELVQKTKIGGFHRKEAGMTFQVESFPWGPHITVQDPHEGFRAPGIENVHSFQAEIGNDLGWSCSPTKLEVRWQWMILLKSSSIVAEYLEIAYPMRLQVSVNQQYF